MSEPHPFSFFPLSFHSGELERRHGEVPFNIINHFRPFLTHCFVFDQNTLPPVRDEALKALDDKTNC
ncbi:hypothetical protein ACQP3L_36625, partial [Escherichia coli]